MRLSRPLSVTVAALPGAAIAIVYAPALVHGVDVWRSDPELSFGSLVVPAAGALLALRWRALVAAAGAGRRLGLAAVAVGLVMLVAGTRGNVHALAGASLLPVALGTLAYLHGLGPVRIAAL